MALVALSPGHSQILSRSYGEKSVSPQLQDKIWEWPGEEAMALGHLINSNYGKLISKKNPP